MRFAWLFLLFPAIVQAQVVPGILREASYSSPPISGAWSYIALGTGVCTSVTDSAGTLTIEASGPDIENGCLVYQTLNTATAQAYGRIGSITGTASATTRTGVIIANGTAADAARCLVRWRADITGVRGDYSVADGQPTTGGIVGSSASLPVHIGATITDSTNACQFFEYDTATAPADPAADFTGVPQPHQSYTSDQTAPFVVGWWVQSGHASNTATVTITDYEVQETIDLADSAGDLDAGLVFREDWETGSVDSVNDWLIYNTMYGRCDLGLARSPQGKVDCPDTDENQCWLNSKANPNSCDGSESHAYAYQVVTSDNGITPRAGNYMIRYETQDGDNAIQGFNERVLLSALSGSNAMLDYNTTYWIGLSRYMPSAEYSPTYTDTWFQLSIQPEASCSGISPCEDHQIYIQYRPQDAGDTTPTGYRVRCTYWTSYPDGFNTCTTSPTGVGYPNPFDAHLDEWMDFRIEVKFHVTNGVFKVWTRRAEVTNTYTLEVDYSGPLGWFNSDKKYQTQLQLYGGGGFPLVLYYDEIKIASEVSGVMTDVDPPNIAP